MGQKPTIRERIGTLPYYSELEEKLERGESLAVLARLIRQRGDLTDVSEIGLVRTLDRMKVKLRRVSELLTGVESELDREIARLEKLFTDISRRVEMDKRLERKMRKMLPSLNREYALLVEIAREIRQCKHDAGILKRPPSTPPSPPRPIGLKIPDDPGARARIRAAAERFLYLAAPGRLRLPPAPSDNGEDPDPGGVQEDQQ